MLTFPEAASLFDNNAGVTVEAEIVLLDRELAKLIDADWWQLDNVCGIREKEGDHSWKWVFILGQARTTKGGQTYSNYLAVRTMDKVVQGAISYWANGISHIDQATVVYIECLATAPRNRPWLVKRPQFAGAGTTLLMAAIRHSYLLGLKGRVALTAFDDPKTIEFYEKFGFARVAPKDDDRIEFELTPEVAMEKLRERGFL